MRSGPDGALYFTEAGRQRIRRLTADGLVETVVGNGEQRTAGDGLPGPEASVARLQDLEIGSDGTLYWLETTVFGRTTLRRLAPGGLVEKVAGGDVLGVSGDGGPAVDAGIHDTVDFAIGTDDSLYLVYRANLVTNGGRIRRISPSGLIETVAGGGPGVEEPFADDLEAAEIRLDLPSEIVALGDGSFVVRQRRGTPLRRLTPDGRFKLVHVGMNQSGIATEALFPFELNRPLSADGAGRIYWTDQRGVVRIGDDLRPEIVWSRPDGESVPNSVTVFEDGSLWVSRGEQVRRLVGESEMEAVAGIGTGRLTVGDGGSALQAFLFPNTVASAPNGGVYVGDLFAHRVRLIRDGAISNFAGTGGTGDVVDGEPAAESPIPGPLEIASDRNGNLFINGGQQIWRVSVDGIVTRHAGDGGTCSRGGGGVCGDGGPASEGSLGANLRMAVDPEGGLFLFHRQVGVDFRRGNVLRRVRPDGVIETLDTEAPQGALRRMAVDSEGRLAIFYRGAPGLGRRLTDSGFETIPGPPLFTSAYAAGADGSFYAAGVHRSILRVRPDGSTDTIVSQPLREVLTAGEHGAAFEAVVGSVRHLAVSPDGDLWIADSVADRVWRIRNVGECAETPEPTPGLFSAAGAGGLAPGVLFSMFGNGLGPEEGMATGPDAEGRFPLEAEGTEVWIGGRRAPLLFVASGQINGVMPNSAEFREGYGVVASAEGAGWLTTSRLRRNGVDWPTNGVVVAPHAPALFALGPERAAALNQDGSINGPLNPAAPGSVVVLFGTGGGDLSPLPETGRIVAGAPLPLVTGDVAATVGGERAQVLYAGAAPGLVSGVLQVNLLLPEELGLSGAVRVEIVIGDQRNLNQRLHVTVAR